MTEERLQEIKDSINFQYELIVSKGIDRSALLFTDEEQELLEEVERLNKENEHLRTALNTKENIIKEVREYIESIVTIKCKYFDYNKALENMIISYDELKKKVEEVGTLEGHFIEVNRDKILEILDKGE